MADIKYNISFKEETRLVIELPGRAEVHLEADGESLIVRVFGPDGADTTPALDYAVLWSTLGHCSEQTAVCKILKICAHAEARLRHSPEERHHRIYDSFFDAIKPYREVAPFEWTDPDTNYSEDVRACIGGFLTWYAGHSEQEEASVKALFEVLVQEHLDNYLRRAEA